MTAETHRKKKGSSSFLARMLPMKNHGLCPVEPSQLLFLPIKVLSHPCHISHWDCRLQTVILCWSQINSHRLEEHLAVYVLQVSILVAFTRTREDPYRFQSWWANRYIIQKLRFLNSLFFSPILECEGTSFSWISRTHSLGIWNSPDFIQYLYWHFMRKALFYMWVQYVPYIWIMSSTPREHS